MSSEPKRIQLSRAKGWRKPEGAIVVSRPSKWGNPYLLSDALHPFPSLTTQQLHGFVVNQFRYDRMVQHPDYPSVDEIRAELAGHDLACWCSLSDDWGNPVPCHADVLLEIANSAVLS
jgi:Domain of unknown function (DUF4326)